MIRSLFFFIAIASTPAWAEVFKWVDQSGKVHYSDTPSPSIPHKDLSGQLEAPPCNKECQDNVQSQKQYREQFLQQRQQSEAKQKSERESVARSAQQSKAAIDAKRQQEDREARARSEQERNRIPSRQIRTP